jgi:hypothetical protein
VEYAPWWVRILSAICLGLGTMIGYQRIVTTLGERLGRIHLTPAQGAAAEVVSAAVIGTPFSLGPEFDPFDDGKGSPLPPPDGTGFRNDPIRAVVLQRLNGIPAYRTLFDRSFPEVATGAPIDFSMFGRAIGKFEYSLTFRDGLLDSRVNTQNLCKLVPAAVPSGRPLLDFVDCKKSQ